MMNVTAHEKPLKHNQNHRIAGGNTFHECLKCTTTNAVYKFTEK